MKQQQRRFGFTIVELLVVIAIIGILAGLLSTAIVHMVETSRNAKNKNDAMLLQAACMQYYHDMKRWPISRDYLNANLKLKKGTYKIAGSNTDQDSYSYTLSFYENNGLIIGNLIDATLPDGTAKSFLDLKGFLTPEQDGLSENDYPCTAMADALLVTRGEATYSDPASEKYGNSIPRRKNPVLVYRAQFIVCPHCDKGYTKTADRRYCDNTDCSYYKSNGDYYRFTAKERKRTISRGQPFRFTFDFNNNSCTVTAN